MPNSQSSNPTISKLLEADADLAAQEVELSAQLQSIQEKRYSLKTVIDMFAPGDTAITPVTTSVEPPEAVATEQEESTSLTQSPVEAVTGLELNGANTDTAEASAPEAPTPQKQKPKKNPSSTSSKQGKKSAPTKQQTKAPDTWQQYVKDEFSDTSLAELVAQVMQQHSKQVLEITTIIDAIFTNNIPKDVRSTARERVSNVLSVGAKSGKWYRGQLGKYSISKAAVTG